MSSALMITFVWGKQLYYSLGLYSVGCLLSGTNFSSCVLKLHSYSLGNDVMMAWYDAPLLECKLILAHCFLNVRLLIIQDPAFFPIVLFISNNSTMPCLGVSP